MMEGGEAQTLTSSAQNTTRQKRKRKSFAPPLQTLKKKINNIHPAHAGGAFLLPYCNTAAYKRLQRLLYHPCSYTANAAKRHTALCRGFSCYLPHFTAANNKPIQAAIIPPAPRWSVSQRRNTSSTYQIPASRPDAVQPSTAALL